MSSPVEPHRPTLVERLLFPSLGRLALEIAALEQEIPAYLDARDAQLDRLNVDLNAQVDRVDATLSAAVAEFKRGGVSSPVTTHAPLGAFERRVESRVDLVADRVTSVDQRLNGRLDRREEGATRQLDLVEKQMQDVGDSLTRNFDRMSGHLDRMESQVAWMSDVTCQIAQRILGPQWVAPAALKARLGEG
ncbi:MAG: hypothetical protein ACYCO4_03590 [Sulfobacillus sp.]